MNRSRCPPNDFPSEADGKEILYGVYDLIDNSAWVSVGIDHDTSVFAVATIKNGGNAWAGEISRRPSDLYHSRWRRVQRTPPLALEKRTRTTRHHDRTGNRRLPFPAWHQQMEQDSNTGSSLGSPQLARTTTRGIPTIVNLIANTATTVPQD
jgi:Rhodopirellula transposase DDE domain